MIAGLLSWWDEDPDWLRETVTSLEGICEVLVAVDGHYQLFEASEPRSDPAQHFAIRDAAQKAGIECVIHSRKRAWATEMEKRTFLFNAAENYNPDWYFVIDADCVVLHAPQDLHDVLEQTDLDVGTIWLVEPHRQRDAKTFTMRSFFRAIPGLRVERNHFTYLTPDNRRLWGRGRLEEDLNLEVVMEHRKWLRPEGRRDKAFRYYQTRDALMVELGTCERCDREATRELPYNWTRSPKGLSADWLSVCEHCAPAVLQDNRTTLAHHGLDPLLAQVSFER